MRSFAGIILFIVFIGTSCTEPSSQMEGYVSFDWFSYTGNDPVYEELEATEDTYLNPILAGFYPDPSICRVDDDFYLINSTFSWFPGVPIFHSKDLVNWNQIGHVLDRPSQLDVDTLPVSRGIFAPTIEYHEGTFYMVTTMVDGGGNFYVTATDPAGPWSDPVWIPEVQGIDPSFVFDDDKTYIIYNGEPPDNKSLYEGHRAIWMMEYNLAEREFIGEKKLLLNGGVDLSQEPSWIEGPHIYKKEGYYYLMAAEGGTDIDHREVILRSKNVDGPYEPYENNPILTQRHLDPEREYPVTNVGHADMVELPNGEWWTVFLGCRPYEDNWYNTGRETFLLPVTWKDGWPVVLEGEEGIPYQQERPDLEASTEASVPMNGNFTWREEFSDDSLGLVWNFLRTPKEIWHILQDNKLYLELREATLYSFENPSFVGRRQQHMNFNASVSLDHSIQDTNEAAGMTVFLNERHYLFIGKRQKADGTTTVFLERASSDENDAVPAIIAEEQIEKNSDLFLKIKGEGRYYSFYYKTEEGADWTPLQADVDGRFLSKKMDRHFHFTGCYIGLYTSNAHFQ